jgi:hypothetical protein
LMRKRTIEETRNINIRALGCGRSMIELTSVSLARCDWFAALVTCSCFRRHRDTNDTKRIAKRWPEKLGRHGRDVCWPELS